MDVDGGGIGGWRRGSAALMRSSFDDVDAGLPLDDQDDRSLAVVGARAAAFFGAVDHGGDVGRAALGIAARGDDDGAVGVSGAAGRCFYREVRRGPSTRPLAH